MIYNVCGIPFSDELYHHGILGMHWGIRRFQNHNGTLTEAGKERYGSDKDKKKLAELLIGHSKSDAEKIKKLSQVKYAATQLKDIAKEHVNAFNEYVKQEGDFYKNTKLYNEYVHKAIDKAMKEMPDAWGGLSHEEIFKNFDYYDAFQGDWDPVEIFKSSNDPRNKALVSADKNRRDSSNKLWKASEEYANAILGKHRNEINKLDKARLASFIRDASDRKAKSLTDRMAYPYYMF